MPALDCFLRTPNSVGNLEKIEWFKKKKKRKSSFVALPSALVLIDIWLKKKKFSWNLFIWIAPLSLIGSRTNRNLHRSLVRCRNWNSNQTTDFESYVNFYLITHTPLLKLETMQKKFSRGEWNEFENDKSMCLAFLCQFR